MRRLSTFSVCFGNPDEDLQTLASVDTEITTANSTDIVAFRAGDFCASKGNVSYHSCIRAKDCAMLVIGSRCKPCQDVRRTLQKRRLRDNQRKDRPSKNFVHTGTPHNMMTWENLLTKLDQQRVEMKSLNRELSKLRQKCEQEIDTIGVQLQDSESSEMKDFMAVCREDVERSFPDENCFQRLFWDQQCKYASSGRNGMRRNPMIIKWCLYIRSKSAEAYNYVRVTGFIKLPSARTLFDYSHFT